MMAEVPIWQIVILVICALSSLIGVLAQFMIANEEVEWLGIQARKIPIYIKT